MSAKVSKCAYDLGKSRNWDQFIGPSWFQFFIPLEPHEMEGLEWPVRDGIAPFIMEKMRQELLERRGLQRTNCSHSTQDSRSEKKGLNGGQKQAESDGLQANERLRNRGQNDESQKGYQEWEGQIDDERSGEGISDHHIHDEGLPPTRESTPTRGPALLVCDGGIGGSIADNERKQQRKTD